MQFALFIVFFLAKEEIIYGLKIKNYYNLFIVNEISKIIQ